MTIESLRTGWTMGRWQQHFSEMFDDVNSQRSGSEIVGRLGEEISGFGRGAVRQDDQSARLMRHFSPRVMAWLFSVSSQFDIQLDQEVWHWYPGVCAHCRRAESCTCKVAGTNQARLHDEDEILQLQDQHDRPGELSEWIAMFGRIYGESNRSLGICEAFRNLYEERDELHEIVRHALTKHPVLPADEVRMRLGQELSDVFAWFAAISADRYPSVDENLKDLYHESCPICFRMPCQCDADAVHDQILLTSRPVVESE